MASSPSVSSPLLRTFFTGLRAHLGNPGWSHPKILNLITSAKTPFPNKVTFTCSRDLNVALSFGKGVFQMAQWWKIHLPSRRHGFDPWVLKTPWRRKWQPTPNILAWESHRQTSLEGHSPWGHRVRQALATKNQQQHGLLGSHPRAQEGDFFWSPVS